MRRPTTLSPVDLADVLPPRPGAVIVTVSAGQWDTLIAAAYAAGAVLLELDAQERPVRAYRRPGGGGA